jgi:hypothetical protein
LENNIINANMDVQDKAKKLTDTPEERTKRKSKEESRKDIFKEVDMVYMDVVLCDMISV